MYRTVHATYRVACIYKRYMYISQCIIMCFRYMVQMVLHPSRSKTFLPCSSLGSEIWKTLFVQGCCIIVLLCNLFFPLQNEEMHNMSYPTVKCHQFSSREPTRRSCHLCCVIRFLIQISPMPEIDLSDQTASLPLSVTVQLPRGGPRGQSVIKAFNRILAPHWREMTAGTTYRSHDGAVKVGTS